MTIWKEGTDSNEENREPRYQLQEFIKGIPNYKYDSEIFYEWRSRGKILGDDAKWYACITYPFAGSKCKLTDLIVCSVSAYADMNRFPNDQFFIKVMNHVSIVYDPDRDMIFNFYGSRYAQSNSLKVADVQLYCENRSTSFHPDGVFTDLNLNCTSSEYIFNQGKILNFIIKQIPFGSYVLDFKDFLPTVGNKSKNRYVWGPNADSQRNADHEGNVIYKVGGHFSNLVAKDDVAEIYGNIDSTLYIAYHMDLVFQRRYWVDRASGTPPTM